jgi:hypothetical protein
VPVRGCSAVVGFAEGAVLLRADLFRALAFGGLEGQHRPAAVGAGLGDHRAAGAELGGFSQEPGELNGFEVG